MRAIRSRDYNLAFIDFLLGLVAVLVILIIVFMASVNPPQQAKEVKQEGIKPNAQAVITVEWNNTMDCDVDIYARDPNGQVVYFREKDNGIMHIDRDDMGISSDFVMRNSNGEAIVAPSNTEYWTLRGKLPGHYLFNVNLFNCHSSIAPAPPGETNVGVKVPDITVKGTLTQINPQFRDLATNTVTLTHIWEEQTLFQFDVEEDGRITNVEKTMFEPIVGEATKSEGVETGIPEIVE
jgi:hypothetical protein